MSITGLGDSYKKQALSGLRDVAAMESKRESANEMMAAQKKQSQISTTSTAAGIGFMVGGPVGAGIGAAAGYLLSSLF